MVMTKEGTVKIQKKGLTLDTPQRWHFQSLKTDIVFDVDGTAEVPGSIAHKLLNPKYSGEYSIVETVAETVVNKDEPKKPEPVVGIVKPRAKMAEAKPVLPQTPPQTDETAEFVKEII
jgi:hypothetical protein